MDAWAISLIPVQTLRLRTLIDPRQARVLLDAYVTAVVALPAGARKQSDLARLPLAFQDRAETADAQGAIWSAWTHGPDAWMFIGQLNLHRARERGLPVLEIDAYDDQHRTKSRTVALRKPDGSWDVLKE
jgi:hypothetical protein